MSTFRILEGGVSRSLIRHAARAAPPSLSERLEEEWLADLSAQRGSIARLRFGLGCCWAAAVIAHELSIASVPVATSIAGAKTMTAYLHNGSSFFSRRAAAFLLIAGMHVILIYGFATGLAKTMVATIPPLMHSFTIDEVRPPDELPPPPPPTLVPARVDLPQPDLIFDAGADNDAIRQIVTQPAAVVLATPVAPKAVNRVVGGPGKGFPNTDDYYPATSRRMAEAGTSTVHVCVDGKGRLAGDPAIAQTSGSARLDEGALKLARAGSGHYSATTEDGQPVSSCYAFRIKFQLRD